MHPSLLRLIPPPWLTLTIHHSLAVTPWSPWNIIFQVKEYRRRDYLDYRRRQCQKWCWYKMCILKWGRLGRRRMKSLPSISMVFLSITKWVEVRRHWSWRMRWGIEVFLYNEKKSLYKSVEKFSTATNIVFRWRMKGKHIRLAPCWMEKWSANFYYVVKCKRYRVNKI